jgi:opacity protein-like surface antigen
MKRILLSSTLALTLAATAAFAQQPTQQPADNNAPAQQQPAQRGHHHQFDAHKAAEHIGKRLNLTDDQTAKIEPILADQHQKMTALYTDTSLSQDQRRQQMRTIFQDTHTQLATVLSPDQMEQLKSMRHPHGGGRHQQQQPDSTTPPSAS